MKKNKKKLSAAEVKERTEDLFEPVVMVGKHANLFQFSVLGFDVWARFFDFDCDSIFLDRCFPGTDKLDLEVFNNNDDCYFFYATRHDGYKPKKGFPIKKIVKKIMKFREREFEKEKSRRLDILTQL